MSIRLNYAKKYVVEYGEESSFGNSSDEIQSILDNHNVEWFGNVYEEFDVSRSDVERIVNEFKDATESFECGIPVDDLIYFFETALNDSEGEFIHFSWF